MKENPNCLLVVTPQGGHLGWVAGHEAPIGAPWTDPVVMEFLEHVNKARDLSTEVEKFNRVGDVQNSSASVHA